MPRKAQKPDEYWLTVYAGKRRVVHEKQRTDAGGAIAALLVAIGAALAEGAAWASGDVRKVRARQPLMTAEADLYREGQR